MKLKTAKGAIFTVVIFGIIAISWAVHLYVDHEKDSRGLLESHFSNSTFLPFESDSSFNKIDSILFYEDFSGIAYQTKNGEKEICIFEWDSFGNFLEIKSLFHEIVYLNEIDGVLYKLNTECKWKRKQK